jgi:DNA repair exonuclease SbcCD ATPase subunit
MRSPSKINLFFVPFACLFIFFSFLIGSVSFAEILQIDRQVQKSNKSNYANADGSDLKLRQLGRESFATESKSGADNSYLEGFRTGQSLATSSEKDSFIGGYNPQEQSSWEQWRSVPHHRLDPLKGYKEIPYKPSLAASDLDQFNILGSDDGVRLNEKMSGIVMAIADDVQLAENRSDIVSQDRVENIFGMAEAMYATADQIYADIGSMYDEMQGLNSALDQNYQAVERQESISAEDAARFNKFSDMMAERMSSMSSAVDGMGSKLQSDIQVIDGLLTSLDHISQDGDGISKLCDQLISRMDESARQYQALASALVRQDDYYPQDPSQADQFFQDQKEYLKSLKEYIAGDELSQLADVRQYLNDTKAYLEQVLGDLAQAREDFQKQKEYFLSAKISPTGSQGIEIAPMDSGGGACEGAKKDGLKPLSECSKSCRTVCRWKENVGGTGCYECPSGSPDSCYDVGAWPADHPWCEPGGICHKDPMMYCAPFGTVGPNLEKLQCTTCKQRPDMCWQKAGGGMTWTNCKLGCWNGKCVFKGKYQETEWDGTPEFIHCFECKTPPPPPTCEELGWGYDWQADCEKNCPDPGKCEEVAMTPKGPKKDQPKGEGEDDDDGDQDDGGAVQGEKDGAGGDDTDGPQEGEDDGGSGGTTSGGGKSGDADQGGDDDKPDPPTDGTPEQPTGGGGGATAGGDKPPAGGEPSPEGEGQAPQKPNQPTTERPNQPNKPDGEKPEITDTKPPDPPDNTEIRWLKSRIKQVDERIASRTEMVNDEREGTMVRASAADQLENFKKEKADLEERLRAEEQKELERRLKEEEDKAKADAAQRRLESTRTRWPDPKVVMQKIKIKELKDAIEALKKKAQEAKEALSGRQEHVDRLNREINLLEREIKHHKDSAEDESEDETQARDTIKRLEEELARKKSLRDELAKLLKKAQAQYAEELDKLKNDYRQKLYAADENVRRRAEVERIDEFYNSQIDLEQAKATRELRNKVFEEKTKELESQIAQERANGNDDKADELQTQLDNMKRGQDEFNKNTDTRIKNMEEQLYQMGYHRNFGDGAGPTNKEHLIEKVNEYAGIVDNEIAATEKKIQELEQSQNNSGGTQTRDQSTSEIDQLKNRLNQLRESRDALQEKQDILKNGFKLPDDIAENVRNTANKFSDGAKNQAADKSFARLFTESVGEEYLHNLRPDVMAKKSVAFAWGMAKGIGSAVKGLGELAIGIADLTLESEMQWLGIESGGIFGTDSSEKLYGVLSAVYDNANFDGLVKAVVAAGGAIDGKLKQLEKSGDIDWATAEFGGEVAGEFVVGDVVIAGAVGKAGKALGLIDDAADVGKVASKVDDLADASHTGRKAAEHIDDAEDIARGIENLDDATDAGRAGSRSGHVDDAADAGKAADNAPSGTRSRGTHLDDAPKRPVDVDKPPSRAPPADNPPPRGFDDSPTGARASKVDEPPIVRTPDVETPPARAPPDGATPKPKPADAPPVPKQEVRPPKPYDNNVPLRDVNKTPPKSLADDVAENIEKEHGFRRDHANRMNEFAQEKGTYLLVRDGNVDSVPHFSDPDKMPKPMSSKAKTAKVGDDVGLVVNPNHERQAKFWDDAINNAKKAGDKAEVDRLEYYRNKAQKSWKENWAKMEKDGYRVNSETGVVEYVEKLPDGTDKVWNGIHGDYDLHGVYKKNPDGSIEHVSFGEGNKFDDNGIDVSGRKLRGQLNDKISGGDKNFVQHGGQDDWIPDSDLIPNKPPDPPVTVFFPDGRPPIHLNDADAMKAFYEGEMGVKWPYPEKAASVGADAAKAADKATDAGKAASIAADTAKPSGLSSGTGAAQAPPSTPPVLSRGHQQNAPLNFVDDQGKVVSLDTGKKLGSGSTSTAYMHGSDPTKVVRVTEFNPKAKSAPILDEVGRNALEDVAKKAGPDSSVRVVERFEKYQVDNPVGAAFNDATVEVTKFLPQGTAENMIARQGGSMTKGQAKAFDAATRQLNNNGYAWLDNHSGNYTFEPVNGGGPDDWKVVVMDPGGIVPMEGRNLAEKAQNARAIQERVNLPRPEFKADMDMVKNMNDVLKRGVAAEEKDFILQEFGSKIDIKAMGITDVNDVAFYPAGTIDFEDIKKLTTMSPAEAKAY